MKNNLKWSVKILFFSFFLSFFFSFISQSLFPTLSIPLSIFIIFFFVGVSVVFDMVAVGVTSINIEKLEKYKNEKGYATAVNLCKNTEKVSSFCGDVVGDICGILSGAGGVSLVLNVSIRDSNVFFITTCLVSSLIAGLTIFGKAILKRYSVDNCEKVVLFTAKVLDFSLIKFIKNKVSKKRMEKYVKTNEEKNNQNKQK